MHSVLLFLDPESPELPPEYFREFCSIVHLRAPVPVGGQGPESAGHHVKAFQERLRLLRGRDTGQHRGSPGRALELEGQSQPAVGADSRFFQLVLRHLSLVDLWAHPSLIINRGRPARESVSDRNQINERDAPDFLGDCRDQIGEQFRCIWRT